VQAIPAP